MCRFNALSTMDTSTLHLASHPAPHARAQALFERIAPEITALVPSAIVEHVGATSVPGCLTKGDLDIAVRVPADAFVTAERALATRFERNTGSDRTDTFSSFADDASDPPLGVQLCVIGSPDDMFHVLRDALRADPAIARAYNELKATFDGRPMDEYRAAKTAWIEQILARATAGPH